ncbi:MAG: hypothetical protein ACMVY4_17470 [Minwuia sp.]|uniref:hypothetical protein n=1 Tax=Minwuia sp. TaxID=2493630 RepID=UPI003A875201
MTLPPLHRTELHHAGVDDGPTLEFWHDLQHVMRSLHQSMPILGPWMEARIKAMMTVWLPAGWRLSGPSQIVDPARPDLRSRSWDIVVHRPFNDRGYPPPASPESGMPLVPIHSVAAVIDTKTTFDDPRSYARQTVFDLMNRAAEPQLAFLGPGLARIVLAAASNRSADALFAAGREVGLEVFTMARARTGPVSDGPERLTTWTLQRLAEGEAPLACFRTSVMTAVASGSWRQQ